jgi:hypothetical protein
MNIIVKTILDTAIDAAFAKINQPTVSGVPVIPLTLVEDVLNLEIKNYIVSLPKSPELPAIPKLSALRVPELSVSATSRAEIKSYVLQKIKEKKKSYQTALLNSQKAEAQKLNSSFTYRKTLVSKTKPVVNSTLGRFNSK